MKWFHRILCVSIVGAASFIFIGWSPGNAGTRTDEHGLSQSAFEQMSAAGDAYLSQPNSPKKISAQELWAEMNDADTTQPYIISVRHFGDDSARGHIPGAVHWDYTSLTNPANRGLLPANKKIVVYCYAGQTSSLVTAYLNLMGYDAYNLKWGMSGWTTDTSVVGVGGAWYALRRSPEGIETTPHELTRTYPFPNPVCKASDLKGMITERFDAYFRAGYKSKIADWTMVRERMHDADSTNDYFIISYMPRGQYNAGHIAGAYCIEPGTLGENESLRYLPPDKPILVSCSSGHASGQVCMYLRMLGYDAWTLRFGANALTDNSAILGPNNTWVPPQKLSYPVEKGAIERH
ncbi:MAG TPA: rhodanese-like domain-containing protein [bacterium]|jgi:rhodanese-related sulfurtransferase